MHKTTQRLWRITSLIMVFLMVFTPALSMPARVAAQGSNPPESKAPTSLDATGKAPVVQPQKVEPAAPVQARGVTTEEALAKIHPDLRDAAQKASPAFAQPGRQSADAAGEPLMIEVVFKVNDREGLPDLTPYFVDGKFAARPPLGKGETKTQIVFGFANPAALLKIASMTEVDYILPIVLERNAQPDDYPFDEQNPPPTFGPEDWAKLRANADKLRAGELPWAQAKAYGDGGKLVRPADWFEVNPAGPHKAESAWARGFDGTGVTVAVLDDGIDAAHPDLMGTQKIYSSTVHSDYNGWPMVFSPISMLLYYFDTNFGTTYVADGYPGAHYVDTSATPALSPCGVGLSCFTYTPLLDYGVPGVTHNYIISDSMTTSGVVHVGTHPDNDLRDFVWGEKPAVIVTDPNSPGVYDTVYVDLDNDHDFRDEKPLTRADTTNASTLAATYNNMVAYRDMNADGKADISGGMLYFIADGLTPLPGSDWMYGGLYPANGDLVAFSGGTFDRSYSHGTQCASNIVGQGVTDSFLQTFSDLPGNGKPAGAVFGMAPGAKVVNISDIYYNFASSVFDAYTFAAIGYDGIDQTGWDFLDGNTADTDGIQVTTNSYGSSAQDNDGWEYEGQYVTEVQSFYAPYLQFTFSTGNGASAYGTVAPPSPGTAIGVGASTEYGSTGWDSITSTVQIMNNDVTPFSNRGPGARGTSGTDVVAGGAFAAGAQELNYFSISTWGALDGNLAWDSWGGTSRSAPVAGGILALIYQAYKDANGTWPDFLTAKDLLMSSATDLNYDTFTQGAGSVNGDMGTLIASGEYGLYVDGADWQPGAYRGQNYPGFAHIAYPGDTYTSVFTITNPSAYTITAGVSDNWMQLVDSQTFSITITPAMVAAESAYGAENRDNFFKAFNFFIPLQGFGADDKVSIPTGTDLMVVRQMFPYDVLDPDGNYSWNNRFYLTVYNWKDVNGDGNVWEDKNGNGVVNFINDPSTFGSQADGAEELAWDDPRTELDRWEFGRFSYHRPSGNRNEMWVHNPLDRMQDGLFIGVRHLYNGSYNQDIVIQYRVDFYQKVDASWMSTDITSVDVPPGAMVPFTATVNVPVGMPAGMYEAAIEINDPGMAPTYTANTSVIPVTLNVGAPFSDGMTLGGTDVYNSPYNANSPYNNAAVRGLFDWGWRAESGDWRFFSVDVDNQPVVSTPVLSETFETWPLTGWMVITNTSASWHSNVWWGEVNKTAPYGSGMSAAISSDANYGGLDGELWSPVLNFSSMTQPRLTFANNFQDYAGDGDAWVDVSTDGGATWNNAAYWTADNGPTQETVDLSAYAGQSSVIIRWRYLAAGWSWYWHIDNVMVADMVTPYAPGTQILVKDTWADAAPHTDIDTIVLGPTPSPLGGSWLDFPWSSYFGPYTLDTVASSPNTNTGAGVWLFDTSSGANEDWVVAPLQDGLHMFLQHNVLFEGDKFDVVFTKTLGTLKTAPSAFNLQTYTDSGQVGAASFKATLPVNGVVADAVGPFAPTVFTNEPIDFVSSNTIEWTYAFATSGALYIDVSTSSGTISDIDLYVFYCGTTGASCTQRGASTSGTANENVYITQPEDGIWLVGINNWSGPAGDFNLTLTVAQGDGFTISGLPSGSVAAGDTVTFTVNYQGVTAPDTYEGVLAIGIPESPILVQVPITIERLPASAFMQKSVDQTTVFPGNTINYTLDVYNLNDPAAVFHLSDPLPAGTEFITVTDNLGMYDTPVYCGLNEGFEGAWPPAGWNVVVNSGAGWNTNTFWGRANITPGANGQAAGADSDAFGTGMDTELWSPPIDLTSATTATLVFDSNFQDFAGNGDAWVDISTDGGATWTNFHYRTTDEPATGTTYTYPLDAYTGNIVTLRWHFATPGWDWYWYIDDVSLTANNTACIPGIVDMYPSAYYDAASNSVVYSGTLPLGAVDYPSADESFDASLTFPTGWDVVDFTGGEAWQVYDATGFGGGHTGPNVAALWWDAAANWDDWLYGPMFTVNASGPYTMTFWATSVDDPSTCDTWTDPYNMQLVLLDQDGAELGMLWDMMNDGEAWTWDCANLPPYHQVTVDLSAYAGQTVQAAWHGTGNSYFIFFLDDVSLPGASEPIYAPSATITVTVGISTSVNAGDYITNTASFTGDHIGMVNGAPATLTETPVQDSAVVHVGAPTLSASLTAPAQAATGDIIAYDLTISNNGDAVDMVSVDAPIPTGTSFYDLMLVSGFSYNPAMNKVMWTGSLAPGESVTLTYYVSVDDIALWWNTLTATGTVTGSTGSVPLSADTYIVPPNVIFLPVIVR
ncbi:MAG: hypothetical protein Fur0018_05420 [Anaerolineales bacterium]